MTTSPPQAPSAPSEATSERNAAVEPRRPGSLGLPLVLLILAAFGLRLYGINWDQGFLFHPDERAILMRVGELSLPWPPNPAQLLSVDSPLNPQWFPYGSFPLYLVKLVAHFASLIDPKLAGENLRFVGRAISATADVGTILLIFLIGRRLYRPAVGLLAAAFVTFAVLAIQQSHFFVVDVVLVFFMTLTVYCAVRVAGGGGWRWSILSGVAFGLAVASKVSVLPFGLVVALAHLLLIAPGDERSSVSLRRLDTGRLGRAALGLVWAFLIAAATFLIVAPYSFIDWTTFSANVIEQSEMVRRIRDYPYTRQYVDVPRYWYEIQQLSVWGLGLPLGIAGWVGLLLTTVAAGLLRRKSDLLILTAIWPYFLITGAFPVKFLRYLLPLVPFLSLLAAYWLVAWHDWWTSGPSRPRTWSARAWRALPATVGLFCLAATAFYALAFVNIYSQPHPAVAMSQWIKQNVPPGSRLAKEHWEEGLPDLPAYRTDELPLYDDDNLAKVDQLVQRLSYADYLVFYSNRLYGTIPRLPERYPVTTEYYRSLFDGSLGYELVHVETSYPNLLGVAFLDDTFGRPGLPVPEPLQGFAPAPVNVHLGYADESFTVYDHPKVLIFARTSSFAPHLVRARLQAALASAQAPGVQPGPASRPVGLLMTPELAQAQQAGGTWSELFDRTGLANRLPALTWLLFVQALALLGLPLMVLLFRYLPDRGYLLGKSLSLLIVVYLVWLGASLRIAPFSRDTIFLAGGLLGLASLAVGWSMRHRLVTVVRSSWRLWAVGEAVFLVAFIAFYLIRLANPDLWHPSRGGEKPMDFAYLNAVIKSTYFPPYDPWFAGGYLNYYYFGQVIVATVIKATGIVPAVAYNLAVPLLFALLAGNVFSLGYNLLAGRRYTRRPRSRWIAGGVAAVGLVGVLGNLDGWAQVVDGLTKASRLPFESALPGLTGLVKSLHGLGRVLSGSAQMPAFDFWRSSRMMPPTPNITEFPYFTFLFADLHAHLIALPFTALAIGLGLAYLRTVRRSPRDAMTWRDRAATRLSGLALVLALGLTVGALRAINSWDYPTYLLLGVWCLFVAEVARQRLSVRALVTVALSTGLLYLASWLFFRPFLTTYELFYTGVQLSEEKTPLHQYAGTFGLFLFAVLSLLAVEARRHYGRSPLVRSAGVLIRHWPRLPRAARLIRGRVRGGDAWLSLLAALAILGLVGLALALVTQLTVVIALTAILALVLAVAVAEIIRRHGDQPGRLFVWGLVGLALALGIGVDLVTIQGDVGRMNTVFKFYLQAWVLWGLAAAFALSQLVPPVWRRVTGAATPRAAWLVWPVLGSLGSVAHSGTGTLPRAAPVAARRANRRPWEVAWLGVLAFLLVASLIYPLAATPVRLADRFQPTALTNDGAAFMRVAEYRDENRPIDLAADYQAIQWLQDNVQGSPVIAEAVTPLYRWGSRVSVYTGLPTIVGWDWHQKQQRWGYQWMVDERIEDVRTLYTTPDPNYALSILREYGVRYLYVGPVERVYYPNGLTKFEQLVGRGLSVIYADRGVTIYEVAPGTA